MALWSSFFYDRHHAFNQKVSFFDIIYQKHPFGCKKMIRHLTALPQPDHDDAQSIKRPTFTAAISLTMEIH